MCKFFHQISSKLYLKFLRWSVAPECRPGCQVPHGARRVRPLLHQHGHPATDLGDGGYGDAGAGRGRPAAGHEEAESAPSRREAEPLDHIQGRTLLRLLRRALHRSHPLWSVNAIFIALNP